MKPQLFPMPVLALALAACGDGNDAPAEAEIPAEIAAQAATFANAGTYRSTTASGSEVVVTLGADGRYAVTDGGVAVEAGSWQDSQGGACMTAEGGPAESCYTIAPGSEPGTRQVTDANGATLTYLFES